MVDGNHQNEPGLNFGAEDLGSWIIGRSDYAISRMHCMRLRFFSTHRLWLKVVFVSFP